MLPKELRPAAAAAKKRAARVAERLSAVVAALRLLGAHSGGKAPAKLAKALAALDKAKASVFCAAFLFGFELASVCVMIVDPVRPMPWPCGTAAPCGATQAGPWWWSHTAR